MFEMSQPVERLSVWGKKQRGKGREMRGGGGKGGASGGWGGASPSPQFHTRPKACSQARNGTKHRLVLDI